MVLLFNFLVVCLGDKSALIVSRGESVFIGASIVEAVGKPYSKA